MSRILRFYRLHLSRYLPFRVVRALALILYRAAYRAYCQLAPGAAVARFDLVPFGAVEGSHVVARVALFPAQPVSIPAPFFLNDRRTASSETRPTVRIDLPKIDVVELRGASVIGGTDFILAGDAAIAPDCFVASADTCPANIFGVTSIDHPRHSLQLFLAGSGIAIESGISLLGQNTTNYAHWLTETLPKLAALAAHPEYAELPLLVDSGLHRNIYDSIQVVAGKARQLILVERWQRFRVQRLICVSQAGYEPYIPHGLFNTGTSQIVNAFSTSALKALCDAVFHALPTTAQAEGETVFLCRSDRSNNLRGLTNAAAIEALLREKRCVIVDPAKLSFAEQAAACRRAKLIVAPIGAALTNMIFAPKGCRVLALSPYYENANYYFYSNLAAAMGHEFFYLLGRQSDSRGHPMHRSYSIERAALERALDFIASK